MISERTPSIKDAAPIVFHTVTPDNPPVEFADGLYRQNTVQIKGSFAPLQNNVC
jgi:hypothetical protein